MIALQMLLLIVWAVIVLSMVIATGVGGALQAAGLSKTESAPFLVVYLSMGILAALTGAPILLWIF